MREFGFYGVLYKINVFIILIFSCFVEIIEMFFFVVSLSEIEIVNLERVGFG